ncbi:MAG: methenyltetrahydromethanopterin cyclohydrolase [Planctomycetaceae bacterium]|nr:methenyltetrahydromethanopterin cyclohydrolase [Planctomycetaceae bacterium]
MSDLLNHRAGTLARHVIENAEQLRIDVYSDGGTVLDFGVKAAGGLSAGLMLARLCLADSADVSIQPGTIDGVGWPQVQVYSDSPVEACLCSQYAGWQIALEKYFAMGSGPIRAAAGIEELFTKLDYQEQAARTVGVLETGQLPGSDVFEYLAEKTGIAAEQILLAVAPTSSQAGNLQVVARSLETCLHKLFEVGFDVRRVVSGLGVAPLSPVAGDDLAGIGRTNDAILYGGRVTLYVTGDDDSIAELGPKVPSSASECFGQPFLQVFEDAGRDFYKIDPHLFSPAEVVFQNVDTGRVHQFGAIQSDVLRASFGL